MTASRNQSLETARHPTQAPPWDLLSATAPSPHPTPPLTASPSALGDVQVPPGQIDPTFITGMTLQALRADDLTISGNVTTSSVFIALVARLVHDAAHRLGWSHWQRRHQARSQASHYQRQATQIHEDLDLQPEYQSGPCPLEGRCIIRLG
ncbi:hypothetical protein [Streptomyces sp. NPDC046712]|uniref:hypothetical protein n=1 Tax=Streptomyces sp. NPDC046712 TaxID=3154802 RepID=UPI0033D4110D